MAQLTGNLTHNIILRKIQFVVIIKSCQKKGMTHSVGPYKSQRQYKFLR